MNTLEGEWTVPPGRRDPGKRAGRWLLLAALVAIASGAVVATIVLSSRGDGTRQMAKPWVSTAIGFERNGAPPPWRAGNGVTVRTKPSFAKYRVSLWGQRHLGRSVSEMFDRVLTVEARGLQVMNMHAENLREIMGRERTDWVEVERVSEWQCLVVDPRVPREWLFTYPHGDWRDQKRLRREYPEHFNTHPSVEKFFGTEWELVGRNDPGGLLERYLPGRRIRFQDLQLSCSDEAGTELARRAWMLQNPPSDHLSVVEDLGASCIGISGRVDLNEERLVFTVTANVSKGSGGRKWTPLRGLVTRAEYRRVER